MEISRKRMIAGTLASTGLAAALFLGGAWTASSGLLALGPTPASASSDDPCCDKHMPMDKMRPKMTMAPDKPMPGSDKKCCDKKDSHPEGHS